MVICPECESTNNEPDKIEGLPTPENAQVWFCKHCLTTFYTQIDNLFNVVLSG